MLYLFLKTAVLLAILGFVVPVISPIPVSAQTTTTPSFPMGTGNCSISFKLPNSSESSNKGSEILYLYKTYISSLPVDGQYPGKVVGNVTVKGNPNNVDFTSVESGYYQIFAPGRTPIWTTLTKAVCPSTPTKTLTPTKIPPTKILTKITPTKAPTPTPTPNPYNAYYACVTDCTTNDSSRFETDEKGVGYCQNKCVKYYPTPTLTPTPTPTPTKKPTPVPTLTRNQCLNKCVDETANLNNCQIRCNIPTPTPTKAPKPTATPKPVSVTIVSPNGNETWKTGSTRTITWTTKGHLYNESVQIALRDNRFSTELGSGESVIANISNSGSYDFQIPTSLRNLSGGKLEGNSAYSIALYVNGGSGQGDFDESDKPFSIIAPPTATPTPTRIPTPTKTVSIKTPITTPTPAPVIVTPITYPAVSSVEDTYCMASFDWTSQVQNKEVYVSATASRFTLELYTNARGLKPQKINDYDYRTTGYSYSTKVAIENATALPYRLYVCGSKPLGPSALNVGKCITVSNVYPTCVSIDNNPQEIKSADEYNNWRKSHIPTPTPELSYPDCDNQGGTCRAPSSLGVCSFDEIAKPDISCGFSNTGIKKVCCTSASSGSSSNPYAPTPTLTPTSGPAVQTADSNCPAISVADADGDNTISLKDFSKRRDCAKKGAITKQQLEDWVRGVWRPAFLNK